MAFAWLAWNQWPSWASWPFLLLFGKSVFVLCQGVMYVTKQLNYLWEKITNCFVRVKNVIFLIVGDYQKNSPLSFYSVDTFLQHVIHTRRCVATKKPIYLLCRLYVDINWIRSISSHFKSFLGGHNQSKWVIDMYKVIVWRANLLTTHVYPRLIHLVTPSSQFHTLEVNPERLSDNSPKDICP